MKYEECKKDYSILDEDNFINIVISIPRRTVHLDVLCEVYDDGNLVKVGTDYPLEDIQECRNDYLLIDPYDNSLNRYVLTEEGLKYLESIKHED